MISKKKNPNKLKPIKAQLITVVLSTVIFLKNIFFCLEAADSLKKFLSTER